MRTRGWPRAKPRHRLEERRRLGPIGRDLPQPLVLTAATWRERHSYPGCDGRAARSPGLAAIKTSEREVEQGRLPAAELYLNMCQGSLAAEQLMPLELDGAVVVNRPSSALNCHRHAW